MEVRHILLATDLSPASWRAMPHAARLAYLDDGDITVAHVTKGPPDAASDARLAGIREGLEQMDVRVRTETLVGSPANALLKRCKDGDIDVIVVTKHGERATGQVLGSVSFDVVRRSTIPVLVAHDPVTYDDPPRIRPSDWHRIIVSTDFSSASHAGVTVAAKLAGKLGAMLEIVTVVVDARCALNVTADGVTWPKVPAELTKWQKRSAAMLDEMAKTWPGMQVKTRAVVAHEAGAAIVAAALEDGAGLIVVPAHGRGRVESVLLGSTSERVLQLSPLPVLVLRG